MIRFGVGRLLLGAGVLGLLGGCVPKSGADDIQEAGTNTCPVERRNVEQAIEYYYIIVGGTGPVTEADLVPDFMRTESATMDIDADGNVVAAPGSGCT